MNTTQTKIGAAIPDESLSDYFMLRDIARELRSIGDNYMVKASIRNNVEAARGLALVAQGFLLKTLSPKVQSILRETQEAKDALKALDYHNTHEQDRESTSHVVDYAAD